MGKKLHICIIISQELAIIILREPAIIIHQEEIIIIPTGQLTTQALAIMVITILHQHTTTITIITLHTPGDMAITPTTRGCLF